MRILVVGGGGREHALAWSVARAAPGRQVWVAPGNAGTAMEAGVQNLPIQATDLPALTDFARREAPDLILVGPEAPLIAGIVDRFQDLGLPCFGPSRAAARLEGSKIFTREFCQRHGIPSPGWRAFDAPAAALRHIAAAPLPLVLKADGLAAGKGVLLSSDREEAAAAARAMLSGELHGDAGKRLLIEEHLEGRELSFMALCDGQDCLPLASARDYKRRDENDEGPNTGGMGAYSPSPLLDAALRERVLERVLRPALRGMAAEGTPYRGFLYAGLMISAAGEPRLLEFNCRLGDPETQVLLPRLRSDLAALCLAALRGDLRRCHLEWERSACAGIVLAAAGYPESPRLGEPISGLEQEPPPGCKIFHAGTRLEGKRLLTAGGRVCCVTALDTTPASAARRAYAASHNLYWAGRFQRPDIGCELLQGSPAPTPQAEPHPAHAKISRSHTVIKDSPETEEPQ